MPKEIIKILIPSFDADEIYIPRFGNKIATHGEILSVMQSSAGVEFIVMVDTEGQSIDEFKSLAASEISEVVNVAMPSDNNSEICVSGGEWEIAGIKMDVLSSDQYLASGITHGVNWARGCIETEDKHKAASRTVKTVHGYGNVFTDQTSETNHRTARAVRGYGTDINKSLLETNPKIEGLQDIRMDNIAFSEGGTFPQPQEPDNIFVKELTQSIGTAGYEEQQPESVLVKDVSQNMSVAGAISFPCSASLADDSWLVISELSQMGIASQYYSVGDTKDIELTYADGTTETITVAIAGFNVNRDTDGKMWGITFIQLGHTRDTQSTTSSFVVDSMLFDALPQDLKDVIQLSKISAYNTELNVQTKDVYLFMPEFTNIADLETVTNSSGGSDILLFGFAGEAYRNEYDSSKFPLFVGKTKAEIAQMLGIEAEGNIYTRTLAQCASIPNLGSISGLLQIAHSDNYDIVHATGAGATYVVPCFRV